MRFAFDADRLSFQFDLNPDCRLVSPRFSGRQCRCRVMVGTPSKAVASAGSVRSKWPIPVSNPLTRSNHSPVSAYHSVTYHRQPELGLNSLAEASTPW